MPALRFTALLVLCCLASACATPAGNYLANRGRDFGEMFRLQIGGALGLGVSAQALGILHDGLGAGVAPRQFGFGWVYGDGYAFGHGKTGRTWDGEVQFTSVVPVIILGVGAYLRYPMHWTIEAAPAPTLSPSHAQHGCWSVLPGALAMIGEPAPLADTYGPYDPDPHPVDSDDGRWRRHGGVWTGEAGGGLGHAEDGWGTYWGDHPRLWSGEARETNPWQHLHAFDIEAGVYAGVLHVRVGFSPGEMLDFFLGWFGADIAHDDRAFVERGLDDRPVDESGPLEPGRSPMDEIWGDGPFIPDDR